MTITIKLYLSTLRAFTLCLASCYLLSSCSKPEVDEEEVFRVNKWEKVTLSFDGPELSESSENNPFLDYRLNVTFSHKDGQIIVPGFYAADGNAAETSATSGKVWQVRFRPDKAGAWTYEASFRQGDQIAISNDPNAGKAVSFNGASGKIEVSEGDPQEKGRLQVVGKRYLKYADTDAYFLKHGAGSPENLLAFMDFDDTYRQKAKDRTGESKANDTIHTYTPHVQDWKSGDPTWKNGKGKGLIGGLNYLKSNGLNSVYFLTLNISGDGEDIWPYTSYNERLRFDCSKLDQWEIVFDHMENLDMMLHFITQETENELLLDGGDTGLERKLYYRELIARFGHHKKVTWNLGEENGWAKFTPKAQTDQQRLDMLNYFEENDPYQNYTVIHSHHYKPERDTVFMPLLGVENLDGMSMQISFPHQVHEVTKEWIGLTEEFDKKWIFSVDEIGPAARGVDPDDRTDDNNQHEIRKQNIWGHLMAGGAGMDWYFGYKNHNNDLACEDWRSRDQFWKYGKIAIDFFQQYLPFHAMQSADELVVKGEGFCFAKPGERYAVYLLNGEEAQVNIPAEGTFMVKWFNPREGGELQNGSVEEISGGQIQDLGIAPSNPSEDWVILITKK